MLDPKAWRDAALGDAIIEAIEEIDEQAKLDPVLRGLMVGNNIPSSEQYVAAHGEGRNYLFHPETQPSALMMLLELERLMDEREKLKTL